MKTLFLLRHGKSSWEDGTLSDHERPLNKRGIKNAKKMAQRYLAQEQALPRLVSSSANRALTTAQLFAAALGHPQQDIHIESDAYTFNAGSVIKVIKKFDNSHHVILLVGHNPGFTEIANRFNDQYPIANVPTCGLLKFDCQIEDWQQLDVNNTTLEWFDYPKNKNAP